MGEVTHVGKQAQPAQLQAEGGVGMQPPAFSLSASPIQMQDGGGDGADAGVAAGPVAADPTALMVGPLQEYDRDGALTYNNDKGFRIDWVRNLQQSLGLPQTSTDGSMDLATVDGVARFQATHLPGAPDGKIGPTTRRTLETIYPVLLSTITGDHLEPRVLVPAGASEEQRYGYFSGIITSAGGVLLTEPMAMNLIGIRGIKIADGSEAHQIAGVTLANGTIYQTSSAQDFVAARAAGTTDNHVSGAHEGFDDMIVSIWVDREGAMHVQERIGNVDPGDLYTDDQYGTGHLMDGQYSYGTGTHGTGSPSHQAAVRGIDDPDNELNRRMVDGRLRYNALRPNGNQEVWREHDQNDRFVSETEESESRDQLYARNNRYVNDNFAMNIHSSRDTRPNSQACMNVPASQYLEFMQEIFASSNQSNVLYTLIDASKLEAGLTIVSSGTP